MRPTKAASPGVLLCCLLFLLTATSTFQGTPQILLQVWGECCQSFERNQGSCLLRRTHLVRRIENERLRPKVVEELQALVEQAYGEQLVDRQVLEKDYVERVLLLWKV